jgi:ribosomal-protein-alanine N-acetyltransferase
MHIETDKLILRPIKIGDAEEIFRLASNPEVSRYLTWDTHTVIDDTLGFIRVSRRLNRRRKLPIVFSVFLKDTNQLIGVKSFNRMDLRKRDAEVGTWLGREYWGQGYSTEINTAFIRYGFIQFGLKNIRFCAHVENSASWQVAEKLGFVYLCEVNVSKFGRMKVYNLTREAWNENGK